MHSTWSIQRMKFPDSKATFAARQLLELLKQQERLLSLPMNAADMTIYETRSQQIGDLIREVNTKNGAHGPI